MERVGESLFSSIKSFSGAKINEFWNVAQYIDALKDRLTGLGFLLALLSAVSRTPRAVGSKRTVKFTCSPALIVRGVTGFASTVKSDEPDRRSALSTIKSAFPTLNTSIVRNCGSLQTVPKSKSSCRVDSDGRSRRHNVCVDGVGRDAIGDDLDLVSSRDG